MASETAEEVDALARELFHAADSTNVWSAVDHMTQLYWRKMAVRRLQAERYKIMRESV